MVFYAYDAGGVILDLINGGAGKIFSSTTHLTRAQSRFGNGFRYGGTTTSDSVSLPISNTKVSAFANAAPFSMAIGYLPVTGVTTGGYITSIGSSGSADNCGFANGGTTTQVNINLDFGTTQVAYTNAAALNVYHTLVCVATTSAAGILYQDGSGPQSFAGTTIETNTGERVNFNCGTPGAATSGGGTNGFVYYFVGWNRVLTNSEANQLHYDPWCFLIYPEDEMFSTLVGVSQVITTSEDQYHQDWSHVGRKIIILGTG